jgi:hypothetical protein
MNDESRRRFKSKVLTELSEHGMGHEPLPPDVVERLEAESVTHFGSRDAVIDIQAFGQSEAELGYEKDAAVGEERRRRHSERFRKVGGMRYPRRVAEAYEQDLNRAMADTDEQVAATVAAWEKGQGLPVTDWPAIGAARENDPI